MSIVKLYEVISDNSAKNIKQLAKSDSIHSMMGFEPIETVVNDVKGADNKLFRAGKLI